MHDLSAKASQAVDFWPSNMVQASSCADQNICSILEYGAVWALHVDVPLGFLLVISTTSHLMFQFDEALDGELVGGVFEVSANFRCWCI